VKVVLSETGWKNKKWQPLKVIFDIQVTLFVFYERLCAILYAAFNFGWRLCKMLHQQHWSNTIHKTRNVLSDRSLTVGGAYLWSWYLPGIYMVKRSSRCLWIWYTNWFFHLDSRCVCNVLGIHADYMGLVFSSHCYQNLRIPSSSISKECQPD
jgi:hypothetical protein